VKLKFQGRNAALVLADGQTVERDGVVEVADTLAADLLRRGDFVEAPAPKSMPATPAATVPEED
jgi:hypothetical protein